MIEGQGYRRQMPKLGELLAKVQGGWPTKAIDEPSRHWISEERTAVAAEIERLLLIKLLTGSTLGVELADLANRLHAVIWLPAKDLNQNRERILNGLILNKR